MHSWDVTVKEATLIQKEMQRRVIDTPLPSFIQTVAGADISFKRFGKTFHACVVVLSYPGLEILEAAYATKHVTFPYVPGYLSFREVPTIVEAFEKLARKPDVLVMDGNGIAHPRRIGVASHLGLMLDIPTIGCAKSKLYGDGELPGEEPGSISYLSDPKTGEHIGAYLRTKARSKPVIISPGHKADLESSIAFMQTCVRGYRIPEPTRQAHILINAYRAEHKDAA
jgi:deoxyribonuclease V